MVAKSVIHLDPNIKKINMIENSIVTYKLVSTHKFK